MVVKSLKCLTILLSCIMLHGQMIAWHMCCDSVFNLPNTNMLITWHLIYDTDIWHAITWHLISHTWYLAHAITWYWYTWPNVVTSDWILFNLTPVLHCLFMIIAFTGTWHDYYTVTRHLVLLNSCTPKLLCSWTPVFLNPWKRVAPDIILLLIPVVE